MKSMLNKQTKKTTKETKPKQQQKNPHPKQTKKRQTNKKKSKVETEIPNKHKPDNQVLNMKSTSTTENTPWERRRKMLHIQGRGQLKTFLFIPPVHRGEELKKARKKNKADSYSICLAENRSNLRWWLGQFFRYFWSPQKITWLPNSLKYSLPP